MRWIFVLCPCFGFSQGPTYEVYITNDTLSSFTNYEFDVMIKANGSTVSFDLKSIQAGIYVNPSFVGTNPTLGCQFVAGSSQMSAPGYNGSIQWNNADKVLNMGLNSATCGVPTIVTQVPLRIARMRLIGFMGFGCGAPDLRFNYVPLPLPMLRLRTELFIWQSACASASFYSPANYGVPTFNGELWTPSDADGKSPVSPYDNNSPGITSHPASVYSCPGNSATFNVSASAPSFPAGGSLSYQWQVDCGAGFTDIPSANSPGYTVNPVVSGDNNCQYRAVVSYTCGGSYISNPAILTTFVANETHTLISCNGDSSTVTVTALNGTPPYTGTGTFIQYAGTIVYPVTDANGCSSSVSVTLTEPAVLSVSAGSSSPVCAGDTLFLNSSVAGGTAVYDFDWSGPPAFISSQANPFIVPAASGNTGTYTVTVTDANGCSASSTTSVMVINCNAVLNLRFFIEGYYAGGGMMERVLFMQGVDPDSLSTNTDTVIVELRDTNNPVNVVQQFTGIVQTNGNLSCVFPGSVIGQLFWIVIRHRSAVQTWSSSPVVLSPVSSFDFTTSASQAFGGNLKDVFNEGIWSFFNGDVNQDESIDIFDFPLIDNDLQNFSFGYFQTDLNGDGSVDIFDFPLIDENIQNFISSSHP